MYYVFTLLILFSGLHSTLVPQPESVQRHLGSDIDRKSLKRSFVDTKEGVFAKLSAEKGCRTVCISTCLSIRPSIRLPVPVPARTRSSVCHSVCRSLHLPASPSAAGMLYVYLLFSLYRVLASPCLSFHLSFCMPVVVSVCPPARLPGCLHPFLLVCQAVCLSACPSFKPSLGLGPSVRCIFVCSPVIPSSEHMQIVRMNYDTIPSRTWFIIDVTAGTERLIDGQTKRQTGGRTDSNLY